MESKNYVPHVHLFNQELTNTNGDYDGRLMCRCGKIKPIPADDPSLTDEEKKDASLRV